MRSPAARADRYRAIESPETFRALAPPRVAADAAFAVDRDALEHRGLVVLPGVVPRASADALGRAVDALDARGLEALFVYAFDATWDVGAMIRTGVSRALGHDYALAADVWAWRIGPGAGRGWAPHRGVAHTLLDRRAPEVIDVWVALSDVEENRACLSYVPLDRDPGYPSALDRLDADGAVALPVRAGDVLAWNANVLHGGGVCAPDAAGPRIACSFTLVRGGGIATDTLPPALDHTARLDLLATQVEIYGRVAGADDELREWARLRHLMRAASGRKER